ncbi:MAG: aminotransferase class I/II-fold pyridoxal phosphate-dependent enzyme [Desulfobacteraceae bacterium]|nr:MAG: aminotransferase class I/II-fold pyridoxal phosphate-dependent enzyme [Desulfobacteraceae bacterium]
MNVPFIDLSRTAQKIKQNVLKDWAEKLEKTQFIGGPAIKELENKIGEYLQVKKMIGCSNGTDAILVGLQALGLKPGQKVAVTNLTFWAPVEAIVQLGCEPVLIDIDPDDLQMSFEEFKKAYEKFRFEAAIFVHLYGWTSQRLKEFRIFCQERNIALLEDAAQAFGVKYNGKSVYQDAQIGTISFYPAKVIGAAGDAGAITSNDAALAGLCDSLINHGRSQHYSYAHIGWNGRMAELQAVYIVRQFEIIEELLATRRAAEQFYFNYFEKHSSLIRVYKPPRQVQGNGYLTVFTSPKKTGEEMVQALKAKGIGSARTYPETMDMQPPTRNALRVSDLKVSRAFTQQVFNLPVFGFIRPEEAEAAAKATIEILKE